jgi:anti-sigma factor RsiW
LSDYFTGHLSDDDKIQVEEHLDDCRECRLSLRTMLLISGKRREQREKSDEGQHYSPQLLGRFYSNPQSLDKRLMQKIESHLAVCAECSEDMAFLQNSDLDLRSLLNTRQRDSGWHKMIKKLRQLIGVKSH